MALDAAVRKQKKNNAMNETQRGQHKQESNVICETIIYNLSMYTYIQVPHFRP